MKLSRRKILLATLAGLFNSVFGKGKVMNQSNNSKKMPVVFFGHGSPMNAIAENNFTKTLEKMGKDLPRPKAILMISAHWETNGTWVTAMEKPKTIHDFYGFPKALYEQQYAAPGLPELAYEIGTMKGKPLVKLDQEDWGLDHGTWAVLRHVFPEHNIPVIQLSIDKNMSFQEHFELGQKLAKFREEGVMIMGSGNIVHNLRAINWNEQAPAHDWAVEFDEWVKQKLIQKDFHALTHDVYKSEAGKLSIPTPDHYIPLLYVIGASTGSDKVQFDFEGYQNASMSMRTFRYMS